MSARNSSTAWACSAASWRAAWPPSPPVRLRSFAWVSLSFVLQRLLLGGVAVVGGALDLHDQTSNGRTEVPRLRSPIELLAAAQHLDRVGDEIAVIRDRHDDWRPKKSCDCAQNRSSSMSVSATTTTLIGCADLLDDFGDGRRGCAARRGFSGAGGPSGKAVSAGPVIRAASV